MGEESEKAKKRQRSSEDTEALADFEQERKRFVMDGGDSQGVDFITKMQQHNREKAAGRERAAPTASDRLRGRVIVRARAELPPSSAPMEAPIVPQARGLVGYASD